MKHYVIYIPGLGDHRSRGQALAVGLWALGGVRSEVFRMQWRSAKPFAPKLQALLQKIDEHVAAGHHVSLVAASAGASAAVNAYAARTDAVSGVVLLCGKILNPQNMHPSVFKKNVSFEQSMAMLPSSLKRLGADDRARIMTVHPLSDGSVPVADTRIESAVERTLPVIGHVAGIACGITLYAPAVLHFLKQLAKKRSQHEGDTV